MARYIVVVPWELRDAARKAKLLEPYAFDHALFTREPQPSRLDHEIWVQIGRDEQPAAVSPEVLGLLDSEA